MRARGFTLIELVVVITIAAVIAVFMVLFLSTPVDSYVAQSRRADLVDSANRILRSVAGDIQAALPNSVRIHPSGTVVALELLATNGVARYYEKDAKSYLGPPQQDQQELVTGQLDKAFYTLDLFASLAGGRYLAVNNQGVPGAYGFGGIMTPLPQQFTIKPDAATGEEQITFAGAGFNFRTASATHSIFLVSGPVSYLCDSKAQTLRRYSGYTIAALQSAVATDAQLMGAGASRSLVAQHVSACSMTVLPAPASAKFGQLAILQITLNYNGEALQVFQEAAIDYLP